MEPILRRLYAATPTILFVVAICTVLALAYSLLLRRRSDLGAEKRLPRQLALAGLCLLGLIVIILELPISDSTQSQLLSLLGIALTGVIGFASTSFVSNAMAGLMLRAVNNFRSGDFVRIGEYFGRVTERGLFHVEIQTEESDLATLPNLYMATTPLTVVRASGTILSASLSLGYDIPIATVEKNLLQAAQAAGLENPFMRILTLGDFSITYRVSGFLQDVKQMLSAQSELNKQVVLHLHGAGVEIVSPSFMNQRRLPETLRILPHETHPHSPPTEDPKPLPEDAIFAKAETAERVEKARVRLQAKIKSLEEMQASAAKEEREELNAQLARAKLKLETLENALAKADENGQ